MDVTTQHWFFRLVEDYGRSPAERLEAMFGIVEHLLQAPDIREKLAREFPSECHCLFTAYDLNAFLTVLATAAKASNPSALAHQLGMLLQGAIAEELRNPGAGALREAAQVARVVIESSRVSIKNTLTRGAGWVAAGGMAAALLLSWTHWHMMGNEAAAPQAKVSMHTAALDKPHAMPVGVSPDEIDAVLALHDKIERGICRAPHLLVMPQGQVTAYMNVIEFRTPEDPAADRKNIREFLAWYDKIKSTECYDPPMNGHTNVVWTKSPMRPGRS